MGRDYIANLTRPTLIQGFRVLGSHNVLLGNEGSGPEAIIVFVEDNLLLRNTAPVPDGGFVDTHGDCTHNRWITNEGETADPPCILEGSLAVSQR
jgi:hypothetical protein